MSKLAALLTNADSKFAGYLKENKIDPQRVLVASDKIERLTDEDRRLRLARRQLRSKEDAAKQARPQKPRSGRPVTARLVTQAIKGESLSGPQKTRLLRALQRVAGQKKLGDVELGNLF